ncbi:MAG: hypothetical protein JW809_17020 [Pirellulales bacterium]|nr:hypothetical protein [Pirellulales bacterium]
MRKRSTIPPILVCGLALLAGCATHADRLREARTQFYRGDVGGAAAVLDREIERGRKDADVLKLDRAIVQLSAGDARQAERTLREVRDQFDYLEQKSAGESALVMVTDDNQGAYAGEDYEKVLIRAFLALSNLMTDGGDATAYSLQVTRKQEEIVQTGADPSGENPKLAYQRVALGAYLHGILRESTHADYDDAARAMVQVCSWEPGFRPGPTDLERARFGRHSAPGHGVVYVFALVGRGPYKEEAVEMPSTVSLLVADRILSETGKHTLPPTVAPIKVPKVVLAFNPVETIQVAVDGQPAGATETITDVGRLALQQYEAIYPHVIGRAVARRVIKKGILYATKEATGVSRDTLVNLAVDAAGVAWEATETADTRCWGLLPDKIQVVRLELPAGEHRLALQPLGRGGPLGPAPGTTVRVADGQNTYILANFPDGRLVGRILTSDSSR